MKPVGPGQSAQLLSAMLPELAQLDIPYAVIGALAASFHGVVRSSLDTDVLISVTGRPGLVDDLIARLKARGWKVEHRRGGPDDPVESVIVVTDRYHNRVDLLTAIRGMSPDYLSRTVTAPVLGTTFEIIGAEDFVAMKVFAGGPRDLEDALGVIKVTDTLNKQLLTELAANYGSRAAKELSRLLEHSQRG